VIKTL